MLKLYYGGCAAVSRMALEEARAEYELVPINLEAGEQRTPEYLAINPKGRVPALATPKGILTENPAILLYVALTYPEACLAPVVDPWRLARMTAFNAFIAASVHVVFSQFGRPERYLDDKAAQEQMRAKAPNTLRDYFGLIENDLAEGPWVLGKDFSTADIYLAFFSNLATKFDWMRSYDRVLAHLEKMKERPSFRSVYSS